MIVAGFAFAPQLNAGHWLYDRAAKTAAAGYVLYLAHPFVINIVALAWRKDWAAARCCCSSRCAGGVGGAGRRGASLAGKAAEPIPRQAAPAAERTRRIQRLRPQRARAADGRVSEPRRRAGRARSGFDPIVPRKQHQASSRMKPMPVSPSSCRRPVRSMSCKRRAPTAGEGTSKARLTIPLIGEATAAVW